MDPIINTFYIYLIELLDPIRDFLFSIKVISTISILIHIFLLLLTETENDYSDRTNQLNGLKKETKGLYIQLRDFLTYRKDEMVNLKNDKKIEGDLNDILNRIDSKFTAIEVKCDYIINNYKDVIFNHSMYRKNLYVSFIVLFLTLVLIVLIPSTETAYKLFILSYITPDNLQLGIDNGKDAIKWLLDTISNQIEKLK